MFSLSTTKLRLMVLSVLFCLTAMGSSAFASTVNNNPEDVICPACDVPTGLSVTFNGPNVTLSWNAVPGATKYRINWWEFNSDTTNAVVINSGSITSYTLNLEYCGTYQWKVRAICGTTTNASVFSQENTFVIPPLTVYEDADGDGYGNPNVPGFTCDFQAGWVTNDDDCDDTNASVFLGNPEVCDLLDNDCDAIVDEGVKSTFYADADGDGYGNAAVTTLACTAPAGYVANSTDCNDSDNAIFPGNAEVCDLKDNDCDGSTDEGVESTFYADADGDGYGNAAVSDMACLAPAGYVADNTDCDDSDATSFPGNPEVCDLADNNCDGTIDEGVKLTFYADADGDGYGNAAVTTLACTAPAGYVADDTDCNDAIATTNPGAAETCNLVDDNCDGTVDEGVKLTFYADADGDGYGDMAVSTLACTAPAGYVADDSDCDDATATTNPGATETCNLVDDNCNGLTDEGVQSTFYADADGDGYGNAAVTTWACAAPAGYVANNTDCDDAQAAANPGEAEVCDGIDNDCDGTIDELDAVCTTPEDALVTGITCTEAYYSWTPVSCASTYRVMYRRADVPQSTAWTFAITNNPYLQITGLEPGRPYYIRVRTICNGYMTPNTLPITFYTYAPYYTDNDGDGFGTTLICAPSQPANTATVQGDCDDNDATVNNGATEICNGKDDDCDGSIDEGLLVQQYADADGDGYGDPSTGNFGCPIPGYVADNTDCDDTDAAINTAATEICDGADNDCDGATDEGLLVTQSADVDGDGYGDPTTTQTSCPIAGWIADNTDCNDNAATAYPGATEVCDGIDNDCDGNADESVDVCTTPSSPMLVLLSCTEATLVWNEVTCATTYTVMYRDASLPAAGNWNYVVTNGQSLVLSGLTPSTTYLWRIYANCGSYSTAKSAPVYFTTHTPFYGDADGDGYGDAATVICAATLPAGAAANNTDCNDAAAGVNPGAAELCNGIDENCNGSFDEGVQTTYYFDNDGDGFGGAASLMACAAPSGYTATGGDCDDNATSTYPGAPELCDGIDNSCNGIVDEAVITCPVVGGLSASNITSTTATTSWTGTPCAERYRITWRPSNAPNNIWAFKFVTTTTTGVSELSPSTTYEWRVRTICNGSISQNSPNNYFTTGSGLVGPASGSVMAAEGMRIMPNPAHDNVTISLDQFDGQVVTIRVADAMGRVVSAQTVNVEGDLFTTQLDLTTLPYGVYTITAKGNGSVVSQRLVKE